MHKTKLCTLHTVFILCYDDPLDLQMTSTGLPRWTQSGRVQYTRLERIMQSPLRQSLNNRLVRYSCCWTCRVEKHVKYQMNDHKEFLLGDPTAKNPEKGQTGPLGLHTRQLGISLERLPSPVQVPNSFPGYLPGTPRESTSPVTLHWPF